MKSKTSRLNLRVSEELLGLLQEIVERKGLNISDIVREALNKYADDEADSWNSGIVKVQIPMGTLEDLETLIMAGDATDLTQAINFALVDWIRNRKEYHLEGKEAFRREVEKVIEERVVKESMRSEARKMNKR